MLSHFRNLRKIQNKLSNISNNLKIFIFFYNKDTNFLLQYDEEEDLNRLYF